jgi:hypothetical protein
MATTLVAIPICLTEQEVSTAILPVVRYAMRGTGTADQALGTTSATPVSASDTFHSASIAVSRPGRMSGRRTAAPLLMNRGA